MTDRDDHTTERPAVTDEMEYECEMSFCIVGHDEETYERMLDAAGFALCVEAAPRWIRWLMRLTQSHLGRECAGFVGAVHVNGSAPEQSRTFSDADAAIEWLQSDDEDPA